jgi:hypothetical protein
MKLKTKEILSSTFSGGLLQYLYLLNHPKAIQLPSIQLIYVPIPKVANRSIKTALADKVGISGKLSAHKYHWDFISVKDVLLHSNYSFAFVRNPLERLVSCFVQKIEKKNSKNLLWKYGNLIDQESSFKDFAEFVCRTPDSIADRHFKSQHKFLLRNGEIAVDYLGKFEHLETDWKVLSEQFKLPLLNHTNKSERLGAKHYYDKELAKKVKKRYAKDIEIFNYTNEIDSFIKNLPS